MPPTIRSAAGTSAERKNTRASVAQRNVINTLAACRNDANDLVGHQLKCGFILRQPWLTVRNMPCTRPKITNCQPAPCQTPETNIVSIVGPASITRKVDGPVRPGRNTGLPAARRLRVSAITTGLKIYDVRKRVSVMCQVCQY